MPAQGKRVQGDQVQIETAKGLEETVKKYLL